MFYRLYVLSPECYTFSSSLAITVEYIICVMCVVALYMLLLHYLYRLLICLATCHSYKREIMRERIYNSFKLGCDLENSSSWLGSIRIWWSRTQLKTQKSEWLGLICKSTLRFKRTRLNSQMTCRVWNKVMSYPFI